MILRFTLELRQRHNPSSAAALSRHENGRLGRVQTFIRRIDAQITEDFGEPPFSSHGSEDYHLEEDISAVGNQGLQDRSISCITTEEYPWAVNTFETSKAAQKNNLINGQLLHHLTNNRTVYIV